VVIEVATPGRGSGSSGSVAGIVEHHGGLDRGLPRRPRGHDRARAAARQPVQVIPAAARAGAAPRRAGPPYPPRDDDRRLLRALADLLQGQGHAVLSAASGAEALALFDPAAVDLVVTDLGMPGMTGWEVGGLGQVAGAHIPVFLLTGWGETVAADERSRYVDRVIAKPVSADALLAPLAEIARSDAGSAAC